MKVIFKNTNLIFEKYEVVAINNIYCLEETPRALDSDALIVSYTYKNADNKNYIIHCTNNDYLIEDSGISEE